MAAPYVTPHLFCVYTSIVFCTTVTPRNNFDVEVPILRQQRGLDGG